jgi:hypothetical protein
MAGSVGYTASILLPFSTYRRGLRAYYERSSSELDCECNGDEELEEARSIIPSSVRPFTSITLIEKMLWALGTRLFYHLLEFQY